MTSWKNKTWVKLLVLVGFFAVIISTEHVLATESSWASMSSMLSARSGFGVAVLNDQIYVVGGDSGILYDWGSYYTNNSVYSTTHNYWFSKQAMPTGRRNPAVAAFEDRMYVIGGEVFTQKATGVNEVYDPVKDIWETKTSMPTPRTDIETNVVNGKIYLIGGLQFGTNHTILDINEAYDPTTDSWTTLASMPTAVYCYASAVLDNKIYIIGGQSNQGSCNLNQIYDPATNTWSYGAPLPISLACAAAGATTGNMAPKRIYVFGGSGQNGESDKTYMYDTEKGGWSPCESMPTPRKGLSVAVVNDLLYVIGGNADDLGVDVNECFTPVGYIPEFQNWVILPILVAVAATAFIYKKKLAKTPTYL